MRAGRQFDRAGSFGHPLQAVVVDQEFFVEIDPRAVIRGDKKRVFASLWDNHIPSEPQCKIVGLLALRNVHDDLRNDATLVGLDRCEGFSSDIIRSGIKVIDLNPRL